MSYSALHFVGVDWIVPNSATAASQHDGKLPYESQPIVARDHNVVLDLCVKSIYLMGEVLFTCSYSMPGQYARANGTFEQNL